MGKKHDVIALGELLIDFTELGVSENDTCLSAGELDLQALKDCKIFHFGSLSLTDEPARTATIEAAKADKEAGALISFDPNYRASLWKNESDAVEAIRSVLSYADMLKISDEESVLLAGEDECSKAAEKLLKQGPKLIAITSGSQGVYLVNQECQEQIPGFPAEAADTTGAGDSFWGGFLSKYLEYRTDMQTMSWANWKHCAKFGNAASSLCVRKRGGIPAIPEKKEVLQILQMQQ
ncbi:MAG: PfkB family carbohydrate kinase [Lachnospiraceae bacterium]|nr:PfkB family carbohydrate kinase [Bacteroides fragilis]MCM1220305.1 PfkB family carbohydrate kinase [Lachnospiraceae bacterium]